MSILRNTAYKYELIFYSLLHHFLRKRCMEKTDLLLSDWKVWPVLKATVCNVCFMELTN